MGAEDDLPLVGRTPQMQALYRLVARVMNTELTVMITGESGTGKSLIARAIHDFSDRRTLPFVVASDVDLEGTEGPSNVIARAKGGSLLFDEVGDLTMETQGRLVRLLDALGDSMPRIMAISQQSLADKVEAGTFRDDLFYRLTGVTLSVPSLRERVDDIPLFAMHFLARAERDGSPVRRFSDDAMSSVRSHNWPGNVRQLENVVRRLVATSSAEEITLSEVQSVLGSVPTVAFQGNGPDTQKLSASVEKHLQRYFDLHGGQLPPPGLYQRVLREI